MKSTYRLLMTWLLCHFIAFAYSQQTPEDGIVRVKFKESYARNIQKQMLGYGQFGLQSTDEASKKIGVKSIRRIFRDAGKFEKAHQSFGLHLWYEITFDASVTVSSAIGTYNKLPEFEIVESKNKIHAIEPIKEARSSAPTPNVISGPVNDPQFGLQWHYENTGQSGGTAGADVSLRQAWSVQTGSPDVIVAIIDGGIDVNHPDLTGSMWVNSDEIAGNAIDDDHNGYVDDVYGYGFGDNTGTIRPHYHGTHVAGTIAAINNNGIGVSGVAGGSGTANGVRLMSCAGFGEFGVGGFEDAMVYAADNGAVISQNSWGGGSQAIEDAIDYFVARAGLDNTDANFDDNIQIGPMAGGIVIFAAGNSNTDNTSVGYPASYPPVVAVASTDHNDVKSYFSNYGSWVDISAPGSNVYSTYPVSLGSYTYLSGTSMACPHVSGVAALIISEFKSPGFLPGDVWGRLQGTADNIDDLNPLYDGLLGPGRVNAFQALQSADGIPPAAIADLAVEEPLLTSVKLRWTATGASGTEGAASVYEIRYSTSAINASNFPTATLLTSPPKPQGAGSSESLEIKNLLANTTYYFAIKARDFFGNVSAISNVVSTKTLLPPVISVAPGSISANLYSGENVTKNLTVTNSGASDLLIQVRGRQNMVSTSALAAVVLKNPPQPVSKIQRTGYTQKLQPNASEALRFTPTVAAVPVSSAGRLFALNHYINKIEEYNTSTGAVIKTITPPESLSGGPDGLAFDGTYLYYISGFGSNDIHRIDPSTGAVVATLALASLPSIDGLAHSGKYVYALDYSSAMMYEIDFDEAEIVRTINPGTTIGGGITFGGSRGTIFVSSFSSGIHEIDIETKEIINTIPAPGLVYGLGYSEGLGALFVANISTGTADALDPDTGAKLFSLPSILSAAMASDESGTNWIKLDPDLPTVVEAGESVIIPVVLNSEGLTGGTYSGQVDIISNDPVHPLVEIPVTLVVTGAPNLSVTPGEVSFGSVFVGASPKQKVLLKNTGTDVLTITSMTADHPRFALSGSSATINAGDTHELEITFSPLAVGLVEGTLTMVSNDPDQPSITVALEGNVVLPPDINVTPSSIVSSLFTGESEIKQLTLTNTGTSNLTWSLEVGSVEEASAVWTPSAQQMSATANNSGETVATPLSSGPFTLAAGEFSSSANSPAVITCVTTDKTTGKVYAQMNNGTAFYSFDPVTNAWATLSASPISSGNNGGAAYLNGKIYTIYTDNSSSIGVYTIATNSWSTMSNALLFGTANITADANYVYVLVGTTFKKYNPADNTWTTLASPPFSFQPWGALAPFDNRIFGHQGNGYTGFASYNVATNTWTSLPNVPAGAVLGAAIDPGAARYYTYGSYGGNNWYSYDIAANEWEMNSIPLFNISDGGMAYVSRAGFAGIYLAQGETGTGFARFESEVSWLSADVTAGTILPGASKTVNVTISAEGLFGGAYEGELTVLSDDPDESEMEIPVSLTVTGAPEISASVSSLAFGSIFTGATKAMTVSIQNSGTDDLVVDEVTVTGDGFSTAVVPFVLSPGAVKAISVVFHPLVAASVTGELVLSNNDPNEGTFVIALTGQSTLPPEINVDPTSIEADLFSGEQIVKTITIENTGSADLTWTLDVQAGAAVSSVVAAAPFIQAQHLSAANNSGAMVSSDVTGNIPLAPGDFVSRAASPRAMTCVAVDPTTGYLYAQGNNHDSFFRYDPVANTWTALANSPITSGNNGGAVFLNGKIYTIYTYNGSQLGVYDIASNTWSTIVNGLGVGSGNITTDGTYLYAVYYNVFKKYNPVNNEWTTLAVPPFYFEPWGGLSFMEGAIYGHQGNSGALFGKYSISANTWTTLPSVPGGPVLGSAIDPQAKKYYAYGSYGGSNWYVFDLVAQTWSVKTIPLFNVNDGGIALISKAGVSGLYFVQGENGVGFAKYETVSQTDWLQADELSGTITAGNSQTIYVTINAEGLIGGDYEGSLTFKSNDPANQEVVVPVSLSVTGAGRITVNTDNVNFGSLRVKRNVDTSISIKNTGSAPLSVTAIESDTDEFSAFFTPFTLDPQESELVFMRFLPLAAGTFEGTLTITSNDANQPSKIITVSGVGLTEPVLELSHESLNVTLNAGQTLAQPVTLTNSGQSDLLWHTSVIAGASLQTAPPVFKVQNKNTSAYAVNNAMHQVNPALTGTEYPLAAGDFSSRTNSPVPLTCVTTDPATGYIYAQANSGYAFYRYSPELNQWTTLASSTLYSGNNGGATVLNNKIYTVYTENSSILGVYDISSGTWSTMANGFGRGTANITTDGEEIYLAEGTSFRKFSPVSNMWTTLTNPPFGFQKWGGLSFKDGVIYGHQGDGNAGFGKYIVSDNHWESLPSLPGGAVAGSAIDLHANKYYCYGTYGGSTLYAFNITTNTWQVTSIPMFNVNDGGLAYVGRTGYSGIYFVQGETGTGFARLEALPYQQWLHVSPDEGLLDGLSAVPMNVHFNAAGMTGGTYTGSITISTNEDVNGLTHQIPVTLTIMSAPGLGVEQSSIDFGDIYVHSTRDSVIVIHNTGTEALIVGEVSSNSETFVVDVDPITLLPGQSHNIIVRFTPNVLGPHAAEITIHSNDPNNSAFVVNVSGTAKPSRFAITPSAFDISLAPLSSVSKSMQIGNQLTSVTNWSATVNGNGSSSLNDFQQSLPTWYTSITSLIPNMYAFYDGRTGSYIDDGGGDMYDGGNSISTNFATGIAYTDGVVTSSAAFGPGSYYFTQKFDGLFVLAADCDIQRFTIDGNLGADGSGSVDATVLTAVHGGKTYKGFVKRVYNAWDPSVNHLIIMEDNGTAVHQFASSTDSDFHQVDNLSGVSRIYYLLFATGSGGHVPNATMQSIMNEFLNHLNGAPSWLTLQASSGVLQPEQSFENQITVSSYSLPIGVYTAEVNISGDASEEPFVVPVRLEVTEQPSIDIMGELEFGEVHSNTSHVRQFTVRNYGSETLNVSSMTVDAPFSITPSSFTLHAYDSMIVDVAIPVYSAGTYSSNILIISNDPARPEVSIPVTVKIVNPPLAELTGSVSAATAFEGEKVNLTVKLKNAGGSAMTWNLVPMQTWVTNNVPAGELPAGAETSLVITANTKDLPLILHTINMQVLYNNAITPLASFPISLTVKANHAPVVEPIPLQTVWMQRPHTLALDNFIKDEDAQPLTFNVSTAFVNFITPSISANSLVITPKAVGNGFMFIKAKDSSGDSVTTSINFIVLPVNHAPVATKLINPFNLHIGDKAQSLNLAENFTDSDAGDVLTYAAVSAAPAIVKPSISGSVVSLAPLTIGRTRVTFTATDRAGDKAEVTVEVEVKQITGLDSEGEASLIHAYPNPFTNETRFDYELFKPAHISLRLFDVTGKPVMKVVDEIQDGKNTAILNGTILSSGVYFYKFEIDGKVMAIKKLVRQ